jgi:hypothetical protein
VRAPALLALAVLLAGCSGDVPPFTADEPRVDFGTVVYGDAVARTVRLRNRGRGMLFLTDVKPNCSCVLVGTFLRTLNAGDTVDVPLTLVSTAGTADRLRGKHLDVIATLDQEREGRREKVLLRLQVALEGEIVLLYRIEPRAIDLGTGLAEGGREPVRVRLRPEPGATVRVLEQRVVPAFWLSVEREEVEGGVDLVLRLAETRAPGEGDLAGSLDLRIEAAREGVEPRRIDERVRIAGRW